MGAVPTGEVLVYSTRRASVLPNAVGQLLSLISYIGGMNDLLNNFNYSHIVVYFL